MAQNYTVQQGDQMSGIAEKFNFVTYRTIWDHPNNAALREKRKNPHLLFPGDVVHIPDKTIKCDQVPTTRVHRYRVNLDSLQLRIVLKDFDQQPLTNLDCVLEVEGASFELKSDASGMVRADVPRDAKTGSLKIPELDFDLPLAIGHLDPQDEETGWIARLIHLGYLRGDLDTQDEAQLRSALEEFQCDHQLKVTGKPDEATKAKLKEKHGV